MACAYILLPTWDLNLSMQCSSSLNTPWMQKGFIWMYCVPVFPAVLDKSKSL